MVAKDPARMVTVFLMPLERFSSLKGVFMVLLNIVSATQAQSHFCSKRRLATACSFRRDLSDRRTHRKQLIHTCEQRVLRTGAGLLRLMWTPLPVRERKRSLEERRGAINISMNGCHASDRAHVSGGELFERECGARLLDANFTLPGFARKDWISSRNDLSTPVIRFVHFNEQPQKASTT